MLLLISVNSRVSLSCSSPYFIECNLSSNCRIKMNIIVRSFILHVLVFRAYALHRTGSRKIHKSRKMLPSYWS